MTNLWHPGAQQVALKMPKADILADSEVPATSGRLNLGSKAEANEVLP